MPEPTELLRRAGAYGERQPGPVGRKEEVAFRDRPLPGWPRRRDLLGACLRENSVCIAAGEGQLYAVNKDTGVRVWKIRPSKGSEMSCSPAAEKTLTFVTTRAAGRGVGKPSLVAVGLK